MLVKKWALFFILICPALLFAQVSKVHVQLAGYDSYENPTYSLAGNLLVTKSRSEDTLVLIDPLTGSMKQLPGASFMGMANAHTAIIVGDIYTPVPYIQALNLNTMLLTPLPGYEPSTTAHEYMQACEAPTLLFYWITSGSTNQLWSTSGTPAGTMKLMQYDTGKIYFLNDGKRGGQIQAVPGKYFFLYQSPNDSLSLWWSDGTPSGTAVVFNFSDTVSTVYDFVPFNLGTRAYYFMSNGLWSTDTTTGVTALVLPTNVDPYASQFFLPADSNHFVFRSLVNYFISDGTLEGTSKYAVPENQDLLNNIYMPPPYYLGCINGRYLCAGTFEHAGMECYQLNPDSMHLVQDANKGMYDFFYYHTQFATFDNKIYAIANDGNSGNELWRLDGTPTGYELMADITPGHDGSKISALLPADSFLFFVVDLPDGSSDIYRIAHGAAASRPWVAPEINKNEWTEVISGQFAFEAQLILEDFALHGTDAFVALNNVGMRMAFMNNDTLISDKGSVSVVKLNSKGQLQWGCDFYTNTQYFLEDLAKGIAVDKQGNCILVNMAWQQLISGGDTFTSPGVFLYMAKINGSTGQVMWTKTFNPAQYDNGYPWRVITDSENNIYIAGNYDNGYFECQGLTIQSQWQPANFMAKFDPDGNIIWLKNTATPWTNYYGNFRKILPDEPHNRIYGLITQFQYNTMSTCQYDSGSFFIFSMDMDGNMLWTKNISGTDLNAAMCLVLDTELNELIIEGKFRGSLTFDGQELQSYADSGCTAYLPFFARLSASEGHAVAARTTTNNNTYPFDAVISGQYLYTITAADHQGEDYPTNYLPDGTSGLKLYRKTLTGEVLDSIKFARNELVWNGQYITYLPQLAIDSEGYAVFADIYTGAFDTLTPNVYCNEQFPGISVTRTAFPLTTAPPTAGNIQHGKASIFPNPFSDYVMLQADSGAMPYTTLEVYDISGRPISTTTLSTAPLQQVPIGDLALGVYVFVLRAPGQYASVKMVRL